MYNHYKRALKCEDAYNEPCAWIMVSTPEILRTLFTAIRTCYSPHSQQYVAYTEYFKYLEKEDKSGKYPNDLVRLLMQIAKHEHLSVFEHVSFTFGIRNVSRSLLAQLTRHRVGWSYSVQSQRYVSFKEKSKHGKFNYIIPPLVAKREDLKEYYVGFMSKIQEAYDELVKNGVKPEDARYLLPNAATTNITVTCNLRAFLDFYKKRNGNTHSQWEIASLAEVMKEEILIVEPMLEYLFTEEEKNIE